MLAEVISLPDRRPDTVVAWSGRVAVQAMAQRLAVRQLFHITRAENLVSIHRFGLQSRRRLVQLGIDALINDFDRHDGFLDRVFLSVGFPNDRLLSAWKQRYPGSDWVVLLVSPDVMWLADCLFCPTNSASMAIRYTRRSRLRGANALARLFNDTHSERAEPARGSNRPRDVQAEVLVPGSVDPARIECAYFERPSVMRRHAGELPRRWLRCNPRYFGVDR